MITNRVRAIEEAAEAVCLGRSDDPTVEDDWDNARADVLAVLDAIGYDELVASRERAIEIAVALEGDGARYAELVGMINAERTEEELAAWYETDPVAKAIGYTYWRLAKIRLSR